MPPEIWKAVVGGEGLYEVSNHGRVRSIRGGRRLGKVLALHFTHDGYFRLRLSAMQKMACVHTLVAVAFIGARPANMVINHKDGNKQNNLPSNLEYITARQNKDHAIANGLVARGTRNCHNKLSESQVLAVLAAARKAKKRGDLSKIARAYSISCTFVLHIRDGVAWNWLTKAKENVA